MVSPVDPDGATESTYRRSAGTARGEARRQELLTAVCDDVATNGLVGFSLRRAAAAAGATHKVLLYHFRDVDDLLAQVITELRSRRISRGVARATEPSQARLSERAAVLWQVLTGPEEIPLLQAMGLASYDPDRYAGLVAGSAAEYVSALASVCPPQWSSIRKAETAELMLATLRGLLLARRTGADARDVTAGLAALQRALDREEEAGR